MKPGKGAMRLILFFLILSFFVATTISFSENNEIEIPVTRDGKGVCGDADNSGTVSLGDIAYIDAYIFSGGTAPPTYLDANADGCGGPNAAVNIGDAQFIAVYIYQFGPAPSNCGNTSDCSASIAGNSIRIGDPPYTAYPGGDSVAIPVYITTSTAVNAISVALEYTSSSGETINSVNWAGSVFGADLRHAGFDPTGKKVIFGGNYFFSSMSSQNDALLVTINALVNGKAGENYSFSKTFYSPAGENLFVTTGGGLYEPDLVLPTAPLIVTNTDESGDGSLRWAITEANNNPGPDTITFDISGTVTLLSNLPAFTDDSTVILGGTAPSGARSFIIDGDDTYLGFEIQSSYNRIEELVIYGCLEIQIDIQGNHNTIVGCYVNVDETGLNAADNGEGLKISDGAEYNTIGGCDPEDANVIGSQIGSPVSVFYNHNTIAGNFIGVSADGEDYFWNNIGIYCEGIHNMIGGVDATCRNVVYPGIDLRGDTNEVYNNFIGLKGSGDEILEPSFTGQTDIGIEIRGSSNKIGGNNGNGNIIAGLFQAILMWPSADSNLIFGNYIGTDTTGRTSLGMYRGGFDIRSKFNQIGDTLPGFANIICSCDSTAVEFQNGDSNIVRGNYIGTNPQGDVRGNATGVKFTMGTAIGNIIQKNIIANSVQNGVTFDSTSPGSIRNTFSQNLIYKSGGLGIDLRDNGVTHNDANDSDTGPNDLTNYPVIDSVFMNPDSTFKIYGGAGALTVIEFFMAHPAVDITRPEDPSGHGEAYSYIGSDTAGFSEKFIFDVPSSVKPFSILTATATDSFGNTSEFCENFRLIAAPLIIVAYSPVNLQVTDPEGGFIGRDEFGVLTQTIPLASYTEITNDSIHIDFPIEGVYIIDVITEDGADPGAVYSIGIRIDGTENCIVVAEALVPATGVVTSYEYDVEEGYHYLNGDCDRNGVINILDIVYLINCKFKGGACPEPLEVGDANCNLMVNILDIVYLVDYKFKGGPEPCPVEE